jgi:SAM-dependent methyltransferase
VSDALEAGAHRFTGFAALYNDVRPVPPRELGDVLAAYSGRRPQLVVDLGSGTGLSSRWAADWADEVVGIEPSDDMRRTADAETHDGRVRFRAGWSHATGLPAGCADVVIAVQAFHWMEPDATLAEVDRCLRPGGVFAAIDCDWPPVVGDAVAEQAWDLCRLQLRVFETRLASGATDAELRDPVARDDPAAADYSGADPHRRRVLAEGVRSWSKTEQLQRIAGSGRFRWWRELAVSSVTTGDAARFIGLLKSQGDYQTLLRHGLVDADLGVDRFTDLVAERLGAEPRPWRFIYRCRLGFKAGRLTVEPVHRLPRSNTAST